MVTINLKSVGKQLNIYIGYEPEKNVKAKIKEMCEKFNKLIENKNKIIEVKFIDQKLQTNIAVKVLGEMNIVEEFIGKIKKIYPKIKTRDIKKEQ